MKQDQRKLLGFRSGTPWKAIIAFAWYSISVAVLIIGITSPLPIEADAYDTLICRLTVVVVFLWMLSPAMFMSITFLRRCVPFLKNAKPLSSITGLMIVFMFHVFLLATVNGLHSREYNQRFEDFFEKSYQSYADTQNKIDTLTEMDALLLQLQSAPF